MLLNLKFVAGWEAIKLRKQRDVNKNNSRENCLRIHNDYQVGDKVLITSNDIHRKLTVPPKFLALLFKCIQTVLSVSQMAQ